MHNKIWVPDMLFLQPINHYLVRGRVKRGQAWTEEASSVERFLVLCKHSHLTPPWVRIKLSSSASNPWEFLDFIGELQLGILFEENEKLINMYILFPQLFPSLKIPVPMLLCGCHSVWFFLLAATFCLRSHMVTQMRSQPSWAVWLSPC